MMHFTKTFLKNCIQNIKVGKISVGKCHQIATQNNIAQTILGHPVNSAGGSPCKILEP
jgi:hypothetical protein